MNRDQVIAILRAHESELRSAGVERLRLFGSVARGDQTRTSDVDLLADLAGSRRWSIFSFAGLQIRLSQIVGWTVDLAASDSLRDSAKKTAEQESIVVF